PHRRRAEVESRLQPAQAIGVPPSAENCTDSVSTLFYLRSYVVDLIHDPLAIVRPARSENVVSHPLAIEIKLIGAQRAGINSSPANGLGQAEVSPQEIGWLRRPRSAQRRLPDF